MPNKIRITRYRSPVGEMTVGSYDGQLCVCDWTNGRQRSIVDRRICRVLKAEFEEGSSEVIQETINQLDEYFGRKRREFAIPLLFTGSKFQCRVWTELLDVPYGTTISYGEVARRIGNPKAVRAVASADATNPISIIVPCHRVIGSDGQLTGYGGGLLTKRQLLDLEATNPNPRLF